jgi:hypothetical protein
VQYRFPRCLVLVDAAGKYVETRFPDGSRVGSTPNRDDHTKRVAEELGYGDNTFAMSSDHELSHTWLAHLDGLPWSRTMWRLAHPYEDDLPNDDEVAEEEERILEFQKTLAKDQPRPWDLAEIPLKLPLDWNAEV